MAGYQQMLRNKKVIQSMSRKGNCLDNSVIEIFFGILKSELFDLKKYNTIEELKEDIKNYIWYYNNVRIKSALKGMNTISNSLFLTFV